MDHKLERLNNEIAPSDIGCSRSTVEAKVMSGLSCSQEKCYLFPGQSSAYQQSRNRKADE